MVSILQTIGIPMDIDPSRFCGNLDLSKHEFDFMSKLIKEYYFRAKQFHEIFQFIQDFCTLND